MSEPIATQGDHVIGTDTHLVIPEGGGTPVATVLPFDGLLAQALSADVLSEGRVVALVGSIAEQAPGHIVSPKSFAQPPSNRATVVLGASTVLVNDKPVARNGSVAETCNDPVDLPVGKVLSSGTVLVG